ncbi:MAG: hypothetical protein ACOYJ2_09115 [Rickettsiales bacterium]
MVTDLKSSLSKLDFKNLPDSLKNLKPSELKGIIDANKDLISTFAPDFPIDKVSGLLGSAADLSSKLPNLMKGGMNVDLNAAFSKAQGNIMEAMKGFKPEQIGPFMQSQIGMLKNFTAGDLNKYASALNIPTGMLSQLPSDMTIDKAGNMLKQGANMMGNFNPSAAGQNISSTLTNARNSIANFPDSKLFNSISGSASMNIPGLGNVSGSTTVGEVRQFIAAQSAATPEATVASTTSLLDRAKNGLSGIADSELVSNLSVGARANIPGIGSVGGSTTVGELRQIISAQRTGLSQMDQQELMKNIAPAVQQQFLNIAQNVPGGAQAIEAARFLQSQSGNLAKIGEQMKNINVKDLSANLQTQWGSFSASVKNFKPEQIGTAMKSFGNSIKSMSGKSVASIQQAMTGNFKNLQSVAGSVGSAAATAGNVAALLGVQSKELQALASGAQAVQSVAGAINTVSSAVSAAQAATSVAGIMTLPQALAWSYPPRKQAACDPMEPNINDTTVASMCEKLRAPVTPLNKLKMRYYDPDRAEESELPSGVAEGLAFNDYFEGNMPYMRMLDTGRSIQTSTKTEQDAMDDKGQYAAIVGVGREGIAGDAEFKDQRCLLGGWGEAKASFGGVTIKAPDPVTSWTELKLYQLRTIRDKQVYCIGRHEKLFKPTGTEDILLYLVGGELDNIEDNSASPLTWRGYIYDVEDARRFPNFPDQEPERIEGLDNAQAKDIVILPFNGGEDEDGLRGLPRLGVVEEVNKKDDNWYVKVKMQDDGDAPDTCGTTDASGNPAVSRYFYKPGHHDTLVEEDYESIGSDMDCADQNLQRCVMATWDDIELYRASNDLHPSSTEEK